MHRRNAFTFVTVLVLLCGCAARQESEPPASQHEAVHTAVVDTLARRSDGGRLVVSRTTWTPSESEISAIRRRATADAAFPAELASALAHGTTPATVTLSHDALGTDVVLARADMSTADETPAWSRVSEAYPGAVGWLRLTQPAFSESGTTAMIAVDLRCGDGCASGWLLLLEREPDDTWRVAREMVLWIT